jgi:lipoprotein signal peptidase
MILVGGGMNLFERLQGNCVADNISFRFFHSNFADIIISTGLLIVIFVFIISKGGNYESRKKDDPHN